MLIRLRDLEIVDVNGHLPQHLGRVGVEDDLPGAALLPDLPEGLQRPDLVVDGHD
jgi:hypothetical protein